MEVEHVQTKREIQGLLERAGAQPRKRFGQHFLIDGNLMRRLCASAELTAADRVLEVGSGTGGLTDLLARRAGEVGCVEIDRALHGVLGDRFAGVGNVRLFAGDVLESKHRLRGEVAEWLGEEPWRSSQAYKLVSNLPYQVATPLVMNLLVDYPQVRRMCFTVQAEVGERFLARAGSRAYGPVSVLVSLLARAAVVARLPRQVFWPAPAVESVMLRLDVHEAPALKEEDRGAFAEFLRKVFDYRRKSLRAAMGHALGEAARDGLRGPVDGTRRPETLTPEEWVELFARARGTGLTVR